MECAAREPDPRKQQRARLLQAALKQKREARKHIPGRFGHSRATPYEKPIAPPQEQEKPQRKRRGKLTCEQAAEQDYRNLDEQKSGV